MHLKANVDLDTCKEYLGIDLKQLRVLSGLNKKPTDLEGDRLIHAVLAKLDAVTTFYPRWTNSVKYITSNLEYNGQFWEEDALEFVNNPKLQKAFLTLIQDRSIYHTEYEPPKYQSYEEVQKAPHNDHKDHHLAFNPNTPVSKLEELSKSLDEGIRENVAGNINAPAHVLTTLADDRVPAVRIRVATNVNTPLATLQKLATDKNNNVRYCVTRNKHAPLDLVRQIDPLHEKFSTVRT